MCSTLNDVLSSLSEQSNKKCHGCTLNLYLEAYFTETHQCENSMEMKLGYLLSLKFPTEWKLAPGPVSPLILTHSLSSFGLSLSLCQCLSWDSINALHSLCRTDTAATIDLSI